MILDGSYVPLAWSSDGAWIYAWDHESTPRRVLRISATGDATETVFEWPFEGKDGRWVMGSDEFHWVYEVRESSSDIWLVENFDPDVN